MSQTNYAYDVLDNPWSKTLRSAKGRGYYGQQIDVTTGNKLTGFNVRFEKAIELKEAEKNVDKFIKENYKTQQDLMLFKGLLRSKIHNSKQEVSQYTLSQLAFFLPWVFSPRFLIEPIRTLLFCAKNNIRSGQQEFKYASSLPGDLLNEQAMSAVFLSIKYGHIYLQQVVDVFSKKKSGILSKFLNGSMFKQSLNSMTEALKSIPGLDTINRIRNGISNYFFPKQKDLTVRAAKLQKPDASMTEEEFNNYKTYMSTMQSFFIVVFGSLRPYGQILINFNYLEAIGQKKMINGIVYYYTVDLPTIMISSIDGRAQIYSNVNNSIELIPESQFNIEYLKQIVKSELVIRGGGLINAFKQQYSASQKVQAQKKKFQQKYLSWDIPIVTGKKQEQIDEFIKQATQNQKKITQGKLKANSVPRKKIKTDIFF